MKITSWRMIVIACAIGWPTAITPALAQHFDVLVTSESGELITGGYNDSNNTAIAPLRVFEGEVVPTGVPGVSYESESPGEPGFRAGNQGFLDGASMTPSGVYTALPGSTGLFFDFLPMTIGGNTRNLFFWDGIGSVSFVPVFSDYELSLVKFGGGGFTVTIDGNDAALVAGGNIQTTTADGAVHTHLFTRLDINDAGTDDPAQGFYLYSLQMRMSGRNTSDPAFFIFGALDPSDLTPEEFEEFEAAHEAAGDWVQANLVPEPSSLILVGTSLLGLMAFVRRCRVARSK
jgi:hypothetical protein